MKIKTLLLAAIAVSAPAMAFADPAETTAYAGFSNDYIWRGVTQSNGDPSAFAGIDITSGPFYVGFAAAGVDFGGDANLETDIMASYKPTLGPVALEFGVLGYLYPQETDLNVWEAKVGASYTTKLGVGLTGAVFYSPEVGKHGPDSLYYEAGVSLPLSTKVGPFSLGLGATAGYYDYSDTYEDYSNVKLSLTAATEKGWGVELGITDTDLADSRGYVTLKKTF